jgi:DNA repair photolyase
LFLLCSLQLQREDVVRAGRPEKGRGAVGNPTGRFERFVRAPEDDGWGDGGGGADEDDPAPPPLRTVVLPDASRSVLTCNASPDIPFDLSLNPYRGCEHGCIYCYARPSHAYLGLSPGLDFETRLFAKREAPALLARELARPGYRCRTVTLGSNTDPYQPVERRLAITRGILEVLAAHEHPVTIVTKSALVARDLDLLAPMAARRLAQVFVSVTTLDHGLARRLEPRAASPRRRLATIRELTAAGVPVGVMFAPVIPGLTDHELEGVLGAAAAAGARRAAYVLLRLPGEVEGLFLEWLAAHAPDRAPRVLALLRSCRGGRLNDPRFGSRMRGGGAYAGLLAQRFRLACRRLGLNRGRGSLGLDETRFRPGAAGGGQQLALF